MIPVFEPDLGKLEEDYVLDALRKGEISGSFGDYIPKFEKSFADFVGVKHAIACTSGTTALQMAVHAAQLPPGSEIMVSACTNIATALAVVHNGHIPIPIDSESKTWNLDLHLLKKHLTPKTKAIIPVHFLGHPVQMEELMSFANQHDLVVIEDCAESHGATVNGKMTGSFGQMNCFSFYANKIITTGEGGMVVTDDDVLAERLKLLRNLGFTKPRFRHDVLAYNFRMTGLQAALGLAQMQRIDTFIRKKRELAASYNELLGDLQCLTLPQEASWAKNVYWMYGVLLNSKSKIQRDDVMTHLANRGIETRTLFCPMNLQPGLLALPNFPRVDCPTAEMFWAQGFYLPSSTSLRLDQIQEVSNILHEAVG